MKFLFKYVSKRLETEDKAEKQWTGTPEEILPTASECLLTAAVISGTY
jgi:hypothetical protein